MPPRTKTVRDRIESAWIEPWLLGHVHICVNAVGLVSCPLAYVAWRRSGRASKRSRFSISAASKAALLILLLLFVCF